MKLTDRPDDRRCETPEQGDRGAGVETGQSPTRRAFRSFSRRALGSEPL